VFLYQVQKNATEPVSREFIRLTDIKEVSRVALAPSSQYIAVDADRRLRLYETEQLLENMNMYVHVCSSRDEKSKHNSTDIMKGLISCQEAVQFQSNCH
jgi:hypothetical protein